MGPPQLPLAPFFTPAAFGFELVLVAMTLSPMPPLIIAFTIVLIVIALIMSTVMNAPQTTQQLAPVTDAMLVPGMTVMMIHAVVMLPSMTFTSRVAIRWAQSPLVLVIV